MRRGLTLVELLVSLGLLSALTAVMVSWLGVTVRSGSLRGDHARWQAAAERVLDLIQEDLYTGDLGADPGDRVRVEHGVLTIATRDRGPVQHRFELDRDDAALEIRASRDRRTDGRRLLLRGVAFVEFVVDEEGRTLVASIESNEGRAVRRRYPLK